MKSASYSEISQNSTRRRTCGLERTEDSVTGCRNERATRSAVLEL